MTGHDPADSQPVFQSMAIRLSSNNKGEADQGDKADNQLFKAVVGVRKQHPQDQQRGYDRACCYGDFKDHVKGYRPAQYFRERR